MIETEVIRQYFPKKGSFYIPGIRIFLGFAISRQIGLVKQNKNNGVTQTSERTPKKDRDRPL